MAIEYYYIDDDPLATIEETAKGLSVQPARLKVNPYQHGKWDDQINFLIENQDKYNGLLLDWGLNRKNDAGQEANFDVEALAQQLRRLIVEKEKIKKDFPIILCSAKYRFSTIFNRELSSHDLFDAIYEKDTFHEERDRVIAEMTDFAQSYKYLEGSIKIDEPVKSVERIMGVGNIASVDYRIADHLTNLIIEDKPIHEIARFLFSKVIKVTGVLVNEFVLAARLGVDIVTDKKAADWTSLIEALKPLKYTGAFSVAWNNWWMDELENWWNHNFESPIGTLTGNERVELLNKKFNWSLVAASKTEKSKSDFFWVVCKKTKYPIAIEDAIIALPAIDKAAWEDDEYFSIDSALELEPTLVHPLERERLKRLKTIYTKVRKK